MSVCPDLFTATCEQRVMDKEEDREKINHNKKALRDHFFSFPFSGTLDDQQDAVSAVAF